MDRDYDALVMGEYRTIAAAHGLAASATMPDELVRNKETEAILAFVGSVVAAHRAAGKPTPLIADVGCGNGVTLAMLAEAYPELKLVGVEKSDDLRALAQSRFAAGGKVEVIGGDLRDPAFAAGRRFDAVVCQRVIINLLDPADQRTALDNIVGSVAEGGALLFIEAFTAGLANQNRARAELGLAPLAPAKHNLYLEEDFFLRSNLVPYQAADWGWPVNFLSTHYYVTRVFHAAMTVDRPFQRNSDFVRFFSNALPPAVGDYSQLRLVALHKTLSR